MTTNNSPVYLLDTQVFLWALSKPSELKPKVSRILLNEESLLYLSIASFWEISIKTSLGKLTLDCSFEKLVQEAQQLGIQVLGIQFAHLNQLLQLAWHHRDPFDRLIAAQAINETMTLISSDKIFEKYGINRLF